VSFVSLWFHFAGGILRVGIYYIHLSEFMIKSCVMLRYRRKETSLNRTMENQLSKTKRAIIILILISIGLIMGLAASEIVLRQRQRRIEKSNHMEEGMVLYDANLGWKLTPNWKGRHQHHDFDVVYSINRHGFRQGPEEKKTGRGRSFALMGDSFTFCLGVEDVDTFVEILNNRQGNPDTFLNFGVPGYSTDQQYLMLRERVLAFSPDAILMVVYLGNDLFDNELPYPLQAEHAKPYFELKSGQLVLKNLPVPLQTKPAGQATMDIARIVMGDRAASKGFAERFLNRFQLFRLLGIHLGGAPDLRQHFEEKFDNTLQLFWAIVAKIREVCSAERIDLALVLMPGQSYIKLPKSHSAQFQDYFRIKIAEAGRKMGVDVIDLSGLLKDHYQTSPGRWYYPNEGHMTPEGQQIVAAILDEEIARLW